ncbi:MAG: nucleotidyltransferase domain-containing protein [Myxococcota bacterium]
MAERLADACIDAGARRVVLFGSLATGDWGGIDIDLAVEGLPAEVYFDLLGRLLWDASPEFTVDLVRAEDAPALLLERIREEGEVLRDRQ